MTELNNGKLSTILLTILTAFAAAVIADPSILGQFGVPAQYISSIALLIAIIYNALYPRPVNPETTEESKKGYVAGYQAQQGTTSNEDE